MPVVADDKPGTHVFVGVVLTFTVGLAPFLDLTAHVASHEVLTSLDNNIIYQTLKDAVPEQLALDPKTGPVYEIFQLLPGFDSLDMVALAEFVAPKIKNTPFGKESRLPAVPAE